MLVGVEPGQVDWSEPSDAGYRAVNVGEAAYEEITASTPEDLPNLSKRRELVG